MKRIKHCINKQLTDICQKVIRLEELNDKIQALLPAHLAPLCQAASFTNACLLLVLSDASWATELRYALPALRDDLRKGGLHQLSSIKMIINTPEHHTTSLPGNKAIKCPTLSPSAVAQLKEASKSCDYEPLKQALLRLARP